jgi:hypothetical protein
MKPIVKRTVNRSVDKQKEREREKEKGITYTNTTISLEFEVFLGGANRDRL